MHIRKEDGQIKRRPAAFCILGVWAKGVSCVMVGEIAVLVQRSTSWPRGAAAGVCLLSLVPSTMQRTRRNFHVTVLLRLSAIKLLSTHLISPLFSVKLACLACLQLIR
jgi:hypothetical protein